MEGLRKMVDPRLGDNYSIDSINKVSIYEFIKHFLSFWFLNQQALHVFSLTDGTAGKGLH
jgi:hypothetical protein